jgi:hypothetical protein
MGGYYLVLELDECLKICDSEPDCKIVCWREGRACNRYKTAQAAGDMYAKISTVGHCKSGYLGGHGLALSVEECKETCTADDECKFVSWANYEAVRTCARYGTNPRADKDNIYLSDCLPTVSEYLHTTYAKIGKSNVLNL